jgi:PPOX class probable F420-dependent enzyme
MLKLLLTITLNFNSDPAGHEVSVFLGEAVLTPDVIPADDNAAYVKKYTESITGIEMTPAEFAEEYPIALKVTPTRLRGF